MTIHSEITIDLNAKPPRVLLKTAEGSTPIPALWLRARSTDPSQRDAVTGQRLMNPHQLPEDLALSSAMMEAGLLQLAFSDGFAGPFDSKDLLQGIVLTDECPVPQVWRSDLKPITWYEWSDLHRDEVLLSAVTDFITLGFLLVKGTPVKSDSILEIAHRFGHIRTTNFGAYFEVYSRPDSDDLAYRPVGLGPHTDNPYRTPVPGIQILQCLQNETSGGLSTLVDSLAVADVVRAEDPQGFALLSKVPIRFEYRSPTTQLVAVNPMIELDGKGDMVGVHYSPRLDDIPLMSEEDTRSYHKARKRLGVLFEDPAYELKFRLNPGEMMMFDNNRVLHGRTAFDPSEGHRQLQGCYIDRDGPRSIYRVLKTKLGSTK